MPCHDKDDAALQSQAVCADRLLRAPHIPRVQPEGQVLGHRQAEEGIQLTGKDQLKVVGTQG